MPPLEKQNISVSLSVDLDTKTDPINSKLGQGLNDCENGRFDHPGRIESRNGSDLVELTPTTASATHTLTDHNTIIGTNKGDLFSLSRRCTAADGLEHIDDGWTAQQIDANNQTNNYIGHHSLARVSLGRSLHTISTGNSYHDSRDIAYHAGTNTICCVFSISSVYDFQANAYYVITDATTGAEKFRATINTLTTHVYNVGVACLDDCFFIYAHCSDGNLYFDIFNTTSMAAPTTQHLTFAFPLGIDHCVIKHATYGNCAFVIKQATMHCLVVDKTGAVKQDITLTHTHTPLGAMSCSRIYIDYTGAEYAFVAYQCTTGELCGLVIDNTGTIVKTETILDARPVADMSLYLVTTTTAVEEPAAGNAAGGHETYFKIFCELSESILTGKKDPLLHEPWLNKIYTTIVDLVSWAGFKTGQTYFNNNLASKAFTIDRKAYVWLLHSSSNYKTDPGDSVWAIVDPPAQNMYLLKTAITPYTGTAYPDATHHSYNLVPHAAAKITNAGMMFLPVYSDSILRSKCPSVICLPNNRHLFLHEHLDLIGTEGQQNIVTNLAYGNHYIIQSLMLATIDMSANQTSTKCLVGDNAIIGGGCVDIIDGECKPINFNVFPDPVYADISTTPGSIQTGDYAYVAIYQSKSKNGELIRSAPSLVGSLSRSAFVVTPSSPSTQASFQPQLAAVGSYTLNWDPVITVNAPGAAGNDWEMFISISANAGYTSVYINPNINPNNDKPQGKGIIIIALPSFTIGQLWALWYQYIDPTRTIFTITPGVAFDSDPVGESGSGFGWTSFTGGVDIVPAADAKAVDLKIPTCHECQPDTAAGDRPVSVILYRCKSYQTSGVNAFYRVVTLLNDLAVSYITYLDTADDASLDYDDPLYTNGGVLENASPPMSNLMLYDGGRVYLVPDEDRTTIWYSKAKSIGTSIEFSAFLTKQITDGGDITGLASMDGKIIVFKRNQIRYFAGDGPSNLGVGDFSPDVLVIPDLGCRSVLARTDEGVVFQSDRGIHMLTRSMQIKHMGEKTDRYNAIDATSAVVMKANEELRFLLANHITQGFMPTDYDNGNIAQNDRFLCGAVIINNGNSTYTWVASVYDLKMKYFTIKGFILKKDSIITQTTVVQIGDNFLVLGFACPNGYMYLNWVSAIAAGSFYYPYNDPQAKPTGPLHPDNLYSYCTCMYTTTPLLAIAWKDRDTSAVFLDFYDSTGAHYYATKRNLSYVSSILSHLCGSTYISCQRVYNVADSKYYVVVTWGGNDGFDYYASVAESDIISGTVTVKSAVLANATDPANRKVFGVLINIPYLDGTLPTYPEKQISLVYNYLLDKWSTDTRLVSIKDTTYLDNDLYMIDCGANLYRESANTFLDNTTTAPLRIETGWLRFGNMQGFGRIYWIYFLGKYTNAYTAVVKLYYDDEETLRPGATHTITGTNPSQFRIMPKYQRCESLKIDITLTPTGTTGTADKLSLSAFDFEIGIQKGLFKFDKARSY